MSAIPRDKRPPTSVKEVRIPGTIEVWRRPKKDIRHVGAHQTLERGFGLLERLWEISQPASLARLSRATGLERSVAHRLLTSLVALGYVHKDRNTKFYVLGHMSYRLGTRSHLIATIRNHARAFIERLSAEVGEVVLLGALEGAQVVYYDCILPHDGVPTCWSHAEIEVLYDAHPTAIGKMLLAYKPLTEVERLYGQRVLSRYTQKTIVSRPMLIAELVRCRQDGFAIEDGESLSWRRAVAAPIVNLRGTATMAIAIVGTTARITSARMPELAHACTAMAEQIRSHIMHQQERTQSHSQFGGCL